MTIRTILVTMDATEPAVVALETALFLARQFRAHVGVLDVSVPLSLQMPLVGEGMSEEALTSAYREAQNALREHEERTRGLFQEACRRQGVPVAADGKATPPPSAGWLTGAGHEPETVARQGRLNDLIVMPRPGGDAGVAAVAALEAAVFESGRPVLVAGASAPFAMPKTVGIAWNGSPEAARAVHGALPFLGTADRIVIFTGESVRTRPERADELKAYLARHDLIADIRVFRKSAERSVPVALLEESAAEAVDLLVMGAFSHSRLHELVLGGVTRYVTRNARLPILMA